MDIMDITDIRKGETGVVIGNGKSLRHVSKDFLDAFPTFGINFINHLPYTPTYFICVDSDILKKSAGEIYSVASEANIAFLLDRHLHESRSFPDLEKLYNLDNAQLIAFEYDRPLRKDSLKLHFQGEYWVTGGTGSYIALKIAFVMGFTTILLVGMDHDADWEHFDNDYPKGFPTDCVRMEHQRYHLELANEYFRRAGKRIVNLSPKSALDKIFERGKEEDWLTNTS